MKKLNINVIRVDGETQSRERIDAAVVADYAEALGEGAEFPPVVVFHDGSDYWMADGFHRLLAHQRAGRASIDADIRTGTVDDAILFALGANDGHGLRRTNADKRRCVARLLARPAWAKWSESKMAEVCRVSRTLVRAVIEEAHLVEKQDAVRTVERAGKTYQQDTSRIGKSKPAATPKPTQAPKAAKRELPAPVEPATDDQLSEAQHTIAELAQENDALRDKLAVESLMTSEEAKTQTAETIRELRALVKTLEAERDALKVSRDTYMRENSELKKQVSYWRKQAEKAAKPAKDAA